MFGSIPPLVKNLLIINVLMLLATYLFKGMGLDLTSILSLRHWSSENFNPYQLVSYMFMHADFSHLIFNMFALYMFGRILEQVWGPKRLLIYYMVTGIGAAIIQMLVVSIELNSIENEIAHIVDSGSPSAFGAFIQNNIPAQIADPFNHLLIQWQNNPDSAPLTAEVANACNQYLEWKRNIPTVGASGAVFGILLAFGMLFPNTELMLLFFPVPIKAKYFVIGYGAIELLYGISANPADNVAHFAHLGGMLFGFLLIKYWNKHTNRFY